MQNDFNVPSLYHEDQRVQVISGFHKYKLGKIVGFQDSLKMAGITTPIFEDFKGELVYEVKVGWFRTIYVYESQIESA